MPSANDWYRLEDSRLTLVIDPACGGKIRSLVSRRTQREYFYQDRRVRFSQEGYSKHDISGMDECFPTVMSCRYPRGRWRDLPLGDHGWLWDRRWTVVASGDAIIAAVDVAEVPIRFTRSCRLAAHGQVDLEYVIESRADEPFEFLYANHLLLFADKTTRIDYPAEMQRAFLSVAIHLDSAPERTWIDWPPRPELGLDAPFHPERGTMIKLFSDRLENGCVAISHGDDREALRIEFDVDQLPHLGVLLAQGFGPEERDWQGLFVGLEATTGIGDDLDACRRANTSVQLQPGESRRFRIRLSLVEQQRPST